MLDVPKHFDFEGGQIVEVSYLQTVFDIGRLTAINFLKALRVPIHHMPGGLFFNKTTFGRILFVLMKPGAPHFLWPGSRARMDAKHKKKEGYIAEVTDEIIQEALRPETLIEMQTVSGRVPTAINQLIKRPVGRPKKDKADEAR